MCSSVYSEARILNTATRLGLTMNSHRMKLRALLLATCVLVCGVNPAQAADDKKPDLLVFAAASLTNVLGDLSTAWTASSGVPVKTSFAASSVLARQVEAGGKADAFVSADQEWMDYLQQRGLIDKSTRRNLVGNR